MAMMAAAKTENSHPTASIPALGFGARVWCKSVIETPRATASPSINKITRFDFVRSNLERLCPRGSLWLGTVCGLWATLKTILMFPHEHALTAFGLGPTMFEFRRSHEEENSCVYIDFLCVLQSSVLRWALVTRHHKHKRCHHWLVQ